MSVSGMIDLAPDEFKIVQGILREFVPGRPVYIFGSRVTGRARRRSDLDLAIGGAPLDLSLRGDLREAFDQSDLSIRVDIVDLSEAKGIFRTRIESEWLPFEVAAEQLASRTAA